MKKPITLSAAALAAVIALAGCGSSSTTGPSTMPADHGSMSSSSGPAGGPGSMGHNSADTLFTQSMIPHHAQAVHMSDMMLGKQGVTPSPPPRCPPKIKAAQGPEIEQMTGWLNGWNEPTGHGRAWRGGHRCPA